MKKFNIDTLKKSPEFKDWTKGRGDVVKIINIYPDTPDHGTFLVITKNGEYYSLLRFFTIMDTIQISVDVDGKSMGTVFNKVIELSGMTAYEVEETFDENGLE